MSERRQYIDERLNIGSGKWSLDGWINIDGVISPLATRPPDIICDIRKIPLPDGCAKEAMAIHVFEHIDRWDAEATLLEWARLLKRGGMLVLEMPDLIKCCRNIINNTQGKKPDQLGMWGLFGEPVGAPMQHKWAYTFKTIQPMLANAGFHEISEQRTMFHLCGRDVRDFRVEATKA
jgi:predicted SAM-dependent methyltransferase